jgi:transcriptional regulator with XRE-family HTH domain
MSTVMPSPVSVPDSSRQLAETLNRVTYAYVSRIEADTRTPSVRTLRELAKRLDVIALYLETGSDSVRCSRTRRLRKRTARRPRFRAVR